VRRKTSRSAMPDPSSPIPIATLGHKSSPVNGSVAVDDWPDGSDDAAGVDELAATVVAVAVDAELVAGDVTAEELCELGLGLGLGVDGCELLWVPGVVEPPSGSTYC
jgi:hypothetical protein